MRQIFGYYKATVGDAGASSMEPPTLKSLRAGDIESTCRYSALNLSSRCAFSVISWTGPQLMPEQGWSSCGSNTDKKLG